jgi:hypothetical protein
MATATTTLTSTAGPDVCVLKTEEFDIDFAQWIVNNKDISKDERDAVKRLMKDRRNGNKHETTYKLGKDIKHNDLGRFIAVRATGLQCLSRECRSALAQKYYWDVDIRNAQPTLLQQYAEKRGWKCDKLTHFNKHRDDYMTELMADLAIPRDEAKERIHRLMFGGGAAGLTSFFVDELGPELGVLMKNIFTENQLKYPTIAKRPNATRSMMAMVLQTEERVCLMAMDVSLAKQGRSLDVLIHDGGLVRKKEGETKFPEEVLRRVERDVKDLLEYDISLVVKPLTTTLEREELQDDYEQRKTEFETTGWKRHTHFKLRFPPMFIAISNDRVEQLHKGELLQNEEDNQCSDGSQFIKRWLEDPNKREYDRMAFEPGGEIGEHDYNMFRGLNVKPVAGDWSIFHTLLNLLVSHDPLGYEYVENWCARRVQRLGEKAGVCLIFQGRKGVGKDTLWDQFGKIFGDEHFHNTSRPEFTVFSRFTSQLARSLLIKFEEANFTTNKENEDQLKGLITSGVALIEKKGMPIIRVNSYVDCVMTTNQETPIPMTDDERRFAAFRCSEEKRGDLKFWDDIYARLKDGTQLSAWLHHLLHKDITGWSAKAIYKSRYYKDLVGVCAPLHARYFCEWVRMMDDEQQTQEVSMGSSQELMRAMNQKFPKFPWDNHKKFGMMMRDCYVEVGPVRKEQGRLYNSYTVRPADLRVYMEERGWWDE